VEIGYVDVSSTSRRDGGDVKGCLLLMGIAYLRVFFINFYILFFNYPLKFTNQIFKYEKYKKTNN
jgi:hypothetical protein